MLQYGSITSFLSYLLPSFLTLLWCWQEASLWEVKLHKNHGSISLSTKQHQINYTDYNRWLVAGSLKWDPGEEQKRAGIEHALNSRDTCNICCCFSHFVSVQWCIGLNIHEFILKLWFKPNIYSIVRTSDGQSWPMADLLCLKPNMSSLTTVTATLNMLILSFFVTMVLVL